jgi:hypothetical protein
MRGAARRGARFSVPQRHSCRCKANERGFALLLVFLLAAAVALMLYIQIPRVAFESERDKEQVLIDRGEGYKRGIQLFYLANRRYPSTLDELEKLGDKRYLRRRYKDPITGKDEWRLIHSNGAFLTDSIIKKPPGGKDDPNKDQLAGNLTNGAQLGGTTPGTTPAGTQPDGSQAPVEVNAAVLRRPSDRQLVPSTGFATPPAAFDLTNANQPVDAGFNPQSFPPITTYTPVPVSQFPPITLQPGATQPFNVTPNQPFNPQVPGQQFPPQQFPGQQFPNAGQQFPGQQFQGQQGQQFQGQQFQPQQFPGFPGQQFPGQQFPGQQPLPGQAPVPAQGAAGVQYRIDANGQFVPINPAQGQGVPGQPQAPGQFFPQGQPGQVPGQNPNQFGQPTFPGTPPGGFPAPPISSQGNFGTSPFPGQPNQPQGNFGAPGAPNAALGIINQLLTTPRQPPAGIGAGANQQQVGGGIAGVASTSTGASIKRYKERGKYNEWEFTFELQTAVPPGQAGQQPGQQPGQNQPPGAPGQTPSNPASPFGNSLGNPFGTPPGAPPAPPRP